MATLCHEGVFDTIETDWATPKNAVLALIPLANSTVVAVNSDIGFGFADVFCFSFRGGVVAVVLVVGEGERRDRLENVATTLRTDRESMECAVDAVGVLVTATVGVAVGVVVNAGSTVTVAGSAAPGAPAATAVAVAASSSLSDGVVFSGLALLSSAPSAFVPTLLPLFPLNVSLRTVSALREITVRQRSNSSFASSQWNRGSNSNSGLGLSRVISPPVNTGIMFVPQASVYIVERFGKFHKILDPGLAILIPFIDRIRYVQSLKENAVEIPTQTAITQDNVTLEIDGVLYYKIEDPYKASYGVENAEFAVSQLAQTTMRAEIGQLSLDRTLAERTQLNHNIVNAINTAAFDWGIRCLRYEIRDVHPPENVVASMHQQVSAERRKRAEILESEGARQSAINIAEGRKQSIILESEAEKATQINMAEGEAASIRLKALASAQAIVEVSNAIKIQGVHGQDAVSLSVAEKYIESFGKLAKEGTTVIVPNNVGDASAVAQTDKAPLALRGTSNSNISSSSSNNNRASIFSPLGADPVSGQTDSLAQEAIETLLLLCSPNSSFIQYSDESDAAGPSAFEYIGGSLSNNGNDNSSNSSANSPKTPADIVFADDETAARAFVHLATSARETHARADGCEEQTDALFLVATAASGLEKMEQRSRISRSSSSSSSSELFGGIATPKFLQNLFLDTAKNFAVMSNGSSGGSGNSSDSGVSTTARRKTFGVDWTEVFKKVSEGPNWQPVPADFTDELQPINTKQHQTAEFNSAKQEDTQVHQQVLNCEVEQTFSIKKSSSKYNLQLIRPYVCVVDNCRKSYTKRRGLIAHGKAVHPKHMEILKKVTPHSNLLFDEGIKLLSGLESEQDEDETQKSKRKWHEEEERLHSDSPITPLIKISDTDGTVVTEPPSASAIKHAKPQKKRNRRLSASDFASDSGGEGLLTAEVAEELSLRIAFLNEQRPFICSQKGCNKRYRNVNGLKYHLEKGHNCCSEGVSDTTTGSGSTSSLLLTENSSTSSLFCDTHTLRLKSGESSAQSLCNQVNNTHIYTASPFAHTGSEESKEEELVESGEMKPFECPHPGCDKAYKNKNGLLYHLRKGKLATHGKIDAI
ncbi:hypothetical protein HK100_005571 [Physocladia obscura]|uniref:C2H2-type domain-containing protein n=1 Tax=Physocladia obscura TaxID=109957 RepID=A0AAD5XHE6_9FUNG|nr:hypothetical protein HK100_005571 [Physocladia obscura]